MLWLDVLDRMVVVAAEYALGGLGPRKVPMFLAMGVGVRVATAERGAPRTMVGGT
jgi:hypothetical protein